MKLTDEQSNAVDLFQRSEMLKISAFAGTGKTSTLSAVAKSTPRTGLYLAFNKSIAAEARAKFPKSVDCRTTHSLAFRAVAGSYRNNDSKMTQALRGNHVAQLLDIKEIAVGGISLKPRSLGFMAAKAVQRFCQSGDDELVAKHVPLSGKLSKIDSRYQEQFREYLSQLAAHLWVRMQDPNDSAPLGHDGYLKLWSLSKPVLEYDYVLLDEAQDTNEAVLSVLRRQDSHLTLVGDRYQQIYEWRGAINAMDSMETDAEAALTQSFRFGSTVADAATSILKALGEKRRLLGNPSQHTRIAAEGPTQTVLCRTNAGVVNVVIDAMVEGRTPFVVGGVSDLTRMLEDVGKLRAIPAESSEFFGFTDWAEVVDFAGSDDGEALRSFVKIVSVHGEACLLQNLKAVAKDEASAGLTVSTAHKAKGREWDSVTLYSDFEPRPSKEDPNKTVMSQEEARLLYVATTRARQLLVVPARLAEKWNVPAASVSQPQVARPSASPRNFGPQKKQPPPLPEFVKVVESTRESTPTPPQGTKVSGQKWSNAVLEELGRASATSPPEPKRDVGSPAQPGLLASLFSLFHGRK